MTNREIHRSKIPRIENVITISQGIENERKEAFWTENEHVIETKGKRESN